MVTDKFPNGPIGLIGLNPIGPIGLNPIGLIGLISLNPSTSPTPCYCVTLLLRYSGVCKKYVKNNC